MSTLISKEDLKNFEQMEDEWLENQGNYEEFWEKKLDDESEFFNWLRKRFEKTASLFTQVSGVKPMFYGKLIEMMTEAAMVGFFFGEFRWQYDLESMIESATKGLDLEPISGEDNQAGAV